MTVSTQDLVLGYSRSVCELDAAPQPPLAARPVLTTEADRALAQRWVKWLTSRFSTVIDRHEQMLRLAHDLLDRDLWIVIDGQRMRLDDYAERLIEALGDDG